MIEGDRNTAHIAISESGNSLVEGMILIDELDTVRGTQMRDREDKK